MLKCRKRLVINLCINIRNNYLVRNSDFDGIHNSIVEIKQSNRSNW